MKKVLAFGFFCSLFALCMFTSCSQGSVNEVVKEELSFDHTALAKKMYSPDVLEGKGRVVDGELVLDVNLFDALTEEERQLIDDAGALYIDKSFNIPYEDAVKIWGENAPIPAEGISFAEGEYESSGSLRGCWVCVQCPCGRRVCTYINPCNVIIIL